MATVTVKCPQCTLEKSYDGEGVIPADWKNEAGELVCPNCTIPMHPIGEHQVMAAEQAFAAANRELNTAQTPAVQPTPEQQQSRILALTKEVERAASSVNSHQSEYDRLKADTKEAKEELEAALKTHFSLARRLTTLILTPEAPAADMPLFTPEAEAAAEASHGAAGDAERNTLNLEEIDALHTRLQEAGAPVMINTIGTWTVGQVREVETWLQEHGSVDTLPACLREEAEAETETTDDETPAAAEAAVTT